MQNEFIPVMVRRENEEQMKLIIYRKAVTYDSHQGY